MIRQENMFKLSLAGRVTVALLVGVSVAATARDITVVKPDLDVPTARVFYGDLNLASLAGEQTLNRRVQGAVRRVCGAHIDPMPYMDCRSFAWRGARPQVERALARARDIAATGTSDIAPVAILIAVPQ